MITAILGPDRLLARRTRDELLTRLDPSGMSIDRLEGNVTVTAVRDAIATTGFFGGGRVVLVTGLLERLAKAATGKKGGSGEIDALPSALASGAGDNSLVFFDPDLDKLPPAVAKALTNADVRLHPAFRERELLDWCRQEAKRNGSSLDQQTAVVLVNRLFPGRLSKPKTPAFDVPPDMETLASEISKLAAYAGDGGITVKDIDELTPTGGDDRPFPLVDAMTGGDRRRALAELGAVHGAGEDELGKLVNQLMTTVELSPFAALARDDGARAAIGKQIGVTNPRRLAAIAKTATQTGARAVSIAQATGADRNVKLGRLRSQEELLYALLLEDESRT